ncbi:hypothetical protein SAMN04488101_101284 [Pedobacter nyackensis]|uniref:Uncharacterized protein n=1 Tax=Pedobacter nyackensis TaxID=475255 RepID=A0A1W2A728_9SPHI|nr:hypothetical protein SAMN04488101_101284 [Pedobacter nyackensis]
MIMWRVYVLIFYSRPISRNLPKRALTSVNSPSIINYLNLKTFISSKNGFFNAS